MIPLDGAKNSQAVAIRQRPLLALYLNEKVPLAWHAGFSGTVSPRGCFPDLPLNQGRDLWSGKISQRQAGMRGGRGRLSSVLWAEFSQAVQFRICFVGFPLFLCFLYFLYFSLNSVIFSEREANARATQNDAQWALLWTALNALQAWSEAASHKAALSSSWFHQCILALSPTVFSQSEDSRMHTIIFILGTSIP